MTRVLFAWWALLVGCAGLPSTSHSSMKHRPVSVYMTESLSDCEMMAVSEATGFWSAQGLPIKIRSLFSGKQPTVGDVFVAHANIPQPGVVGYTEPFTVIRKPLEKEILYAIITLEACSPWVAAHEIGHALGLKHRHDRGALMFPSVQGGGWELDAGEIDATVVVSAE